MNGNIERIHLQETVKAQIVALRQEGWSLNQLARRFMVSKGAVQHICERWENFERLKRKEGSGRLKITTEEQDAALILEVSRNPFNALQMSIEASEFPGSLTTGSRRLKQAGIRNYTAVKKPALTENHRARRLEFAVQHVGNDEDFWRRVVFTDEKTFQSCPNRSLRVYRPRGERLNPRYLNKISSSGRFSVNVWAWITADGPGMMWKIGGRFTARRYVNEILECIMLPSVNLLYGENFIFQQDNCPVHTSRIAREWFQNYNINLLPWPACSADLNPIENVWAMLVKAIPHQQFRNADELITAIETAWDNLDPVKVSNCVMSMPRRLESVIALNGEMTKY